MILFSGRAGILATLTGEQVEQVGRAWEDIKDRLDRELEIVWFCYSLTKGDM